MASLTVADITGLKVAYLRSELAARGRSTEGLLKAELATELAQAVAEEEQAAKTKKRKANQTVSAEFHTSVAECPVSRAARRCGVAWHGAAWHGASDCRQLRYPILDAPLHRYAWSIWTMRYIHARTKVTTFVVSSRWPRAVCASRCRLTVLTLHHGAVHRRVLEAVG
jgi:hypothetical protein